MIGIYDVFMLPFESLYLHKGRQALCKEVSGKTLEIGAGTGANLRYYDSKKVSSLTVIDQDLDNRLIQRLQLQSIPHRVVKGTVESLPFDDNAFDAIVFTLLFCTVTDVNKGLTEVFRVLRPGGTLYFMEHVLPSHEPFHRLFQWVNPAWNRFSGGCNLNRDFLSSIQKIPFKEINSTPVSKEMFIRGVAKK